MSKFTCLVLCAVSVSFSSVYTAAIEEQKPNLRDALRPVIVACSTEHGVSDADIKAAKEAGTAKDIKPCFLGCVFNKAGFINGQGQIDMDTGLSNLRKIVTDDEQYKKYADVGKQCASVNDKAVSDGEAGCEKGALLATCFLEQRANILI